VTRPDLPARVEGAIVDLRNAAIRYGAAISPAASDVMDLAEIALMKAIAEALERARKGGHDET